MNRFFAFMAMAASAGGHLFAGSQLSLLKEAFADYANPLEGVVMKVTEEYDGDEGVILEDLKKSNIPAVGISYTFLARDGLMHWQSPTNFSKNIEDGYYDGDSLVMTNTVNPHMLEIYDGKDVYLHLPVPWHAYLSLFWRLQDLLKKPPEGMAVSKAADGGFLIAWNSEDCVNMLSLDKGLLPKGMEIRYSDGKPFYNIAVEKKENGFVLKGEVFNDSGGLMCRKKITVEFDADSGFPKDAGVRAFGFCDVFDNRGGLRRHYVVVDKLPPKDFIDRLFENPDDVERYNREMLRFAPANSDYQKIEEEIRKK